MHARMHASCADVYVCMGPEHGVDLRKIKHAHAWGLSAVLLPVRAVGLRAFCTGALRTTGSLCTEDLVQEHEDIGRRLLRKWRQVKGQSLQMEAKHKWRRQGLT
jgi:hypothetical protein